MPSNQNAGVRKKTLGLIVNFALVASMALGSVAHAAYLTRVPVPTPKKKVCASGQACGNICISRRYVCRQAAKTTPTKSASATKQARY
jgi:hypothetical protein